MMKIEDFYDDFMPSKIEDAEFSVMMHETLLEKSDIYRDWWQGLSESDREANTKRADDYHSEIERRREEEAEELRLAKIEGRRDDLERSGIPVKDVERLMSGDISETSAMTVVREFLASDPHGEDGGILVLSGTRGCGKTTAAGWLLAARTDPRIAEPHAGTAFVAQEWGGEAWEAQAAISRRASGGKFLDVSKLARVSRYDDSQMSPLEKTAVLVIDDLGMEFADQKGSFLATLDGLINARYAAKLTTVITTNLPANEFKARYGERIADRIRESGRYVELKGNSLRGQA